MEWYPAGVVQVRPAATGCFHLDLEVPPAVAQSYQVPGQFLRLKPAAVPDGFFALAQAPNGGQRFEFLVKHGTPIATELFAMGAGSTLEVSLAQGKGFPVEATRGQNLLLVATGTGLAPMRAVIDHVRAARAAWGRVELLFGAFTPAHFPWPQEFSRWAEDGITVKTIISDPFPGWSGELGFVQRLVENAAVDGAHAFLVGQREMVAEVRAMLTSRGLAADRVHLNF